MGWEVLSLEQRQQTSATPNHHCHHEPAISQYTQPWRKSLSRSGWHTHPQERYYMNLQTNRNRHTVQLFSHAPADAAIFPCFHLGQLLNSLPCLIHWSITEKHFEKHHIKIEGYCTCRCVCGTEVTIWEWPSVKEDSVRAKTLETLTLRSSCDSCLFVCAH